MKVIKILFGVLIGLFALAHFIYLTLSIIHSRELSFIFGGLFWFLISAAISIVLFISAFKKKPISMQNSVLGLESENIQFEIRYRITKLDYWLWGCRAILKNKAVLLIYSIFAVFMAMSILNKHGLETVAVLASILMIGFILVIVYTAHLILFTILTLFSLSARKNKGVLTNHKITFNKNGYVEETEVNRSEEKWKGVYKIEKGRMHIYLFTSAVRAHIIPKKAFKSDIEYDTFYNRLQILRTSAMTNDGAVDSAG